MPAGNGYSIGQDSSVVLIDSILGRIDFSIVTDFDSKETSKTVFVVPMAGPELRDEIPQGWEGSFGVDRATTAVDDYFATRAATFFASGKLPTIKLYHYVNEVSGAQSVWEFSGVTLKLGDGGKWAGPEVVKQKISFFASTKVRIA